MPASYEIADTLLATVYFLAVVTALQVIVVRTAVRNPALRPHIMTLRLAALAWCAMALVKKAVLDELLPPTDALYHELIAREVADLFRDGLHREAFSYFGIGNPAYRFLLGVFYYCTGAPELIAYAVNGALGFWGMLALLDVLSSTVGTRRIPLSIVLTCTFLPSGILWTTTNLKEGAVLWGICMMGYWTLPSAGPRRGAVLAAAGAATVAVLRPHIGLLWMVTIGIFVLLRERRLAIVGVIAVGSLAGLALIKTMAPDMFDAAVSGGVSSSLDSQYERVTDDANLVSRHFANSHPTPVLTGLALILFRPWPTETLHIGEVFAGLEAWCIALLGLYYWRSLPKPMYFLRHPRIIAYGLGLLMFGFLFSYMYNMGLAVRQRLMAYPAVLTLYFWPTLELGRLRTLHALSQTGARLQPQRMPLPQAARATVASA